MSDEQQTPGEEGPKPPALTEKDAVELYLLDRFEDKVAEVVKSRKEALKSKLGPSTTFAAAGLDFKTAKLQSRKTFAPDLALAKLKDTKYAEIDLVIKPIGPVSAIPQEAFDYLSKYFNIEKRVTVTEGNAALAIQNGDATEEECYTKGKEFFNLTLPSKVSDDELSQKYKSLNGDLTAALLAAPNGSKG